MLEHKVRRADATSFNLWQVIIRFTSLFLIQNVLSRRGIGRFLGKGMCPVMVGLSADARVGSYFRMA